MNKFEQLIEYVINDESEKARELFHDIVVEKSRTIYEEMMEAEEAEDDDTVEEGFDMEEELMGDIDTEEQGVNMEDDEMGDEFGAEDDGFADEMGGDDEMGEEGLEDRVVDLEDKLDELMAEFEQLMGGEAGEEEHSDLDFDDELGGDASDEYVDDVEVSDDMDGEEVQDNELETEGFMEAINLKAAPTPQRTEGDGINKKAVYAANSGARGAMAKPVKTGTSDGGHHDSAAYKNTTKEMIGKVGNTPAQSTQKPTPAKKPNLGQASGVNTKSVIQ